MLTPRQKQLVILIARGYEIKEAADLMGTTNKTAQNQWQKAKDNMKFKNTVMATHWAIREKLVPIHEN